VVPDKHNEKRILSTRARKYKAKIERDVMMGTGLSSLKGNNLACRLFFFSIAPRLCWCKS